MSELMDKVTSMVNDWVTSVGVKPAEVYDAPKKTWHMKRGSAFIDIMLLSVPVGNNIIREFIQIACPIVKVPKGKELPFFQKLLELNDLKLGVKLSKQKDSEQIWALYERDIIGIDYTEVVTCIEDLGFWADQLDDELINEFGASR